MYNLGLVLQMNSGNSPTWVQCMGNFLYGVDDTWEALMRALAFKYWMYQQREMHACAATMHSCCDDHTNGYNETELLDHEFDHSMHIIPWGNSGWPLKKEIWWLSYGSSFSINGHCTYMTSAGNELLLALELQPQQMNTLKHLVHHLVFSKFRVSMISGDLILCQ